MFGAVADRAELGTHAVFGHHGTGDLGGLLDIGDRTGGRLAEHQFLGGPPAHREDQPRDHLRAGHQALVVLGHRHGVTAGAATRQDGDLVDRLDIGHRPGRQGVAALVVGGDLLLVLADDAALAARTTDDPVDGLFQRRAGDDGAVLAGGQQRPLVDDVGQIGTGHPDGALGQALQIGVAGDGLARRVHLENCAPAGQVRVGHRDLAVEPAGTQQGRIQDVGAVGRGDQDDALPLTETVHLDQQLVQRLLTLVVAAAQTGATLTPDGVDLVDEDDAGTVLLGLLEQVTHPGGADADEHLDEVRTRNREERNAGLTGDGAGQQRLTGSGRAEQQHTLGDLRAERLVPARVLQEVLDLVELFDRLIGAGHIGEGGLGHVLGQLLGLGLAETEAHPATGLHAGEHHEQADQQQQRQHVDEQGAQHAALVDHRVDRGVLGAQRVEQLHPDTGRVLGEDFVAVLGVAVARLQLEPELLLTVVDLGALDVVRVDLGHRHRGVDRLESAGVVAEVEEGPTQQQHDGYRRQRADDVFTVHRYLRPAWVRPARSFR
ncbi:hypothetical protein MYFR107205_29655 [Mycolicibacterium frederiksbergense]